MSTRRQTHHSSRNHTSSTNYRNQQQRQQQRGYNPRNEDDHDDEEKEDDVLKFLKIRTYYAPPQDEIDFEEVVADVESNMCGICQFEYEDEENIGELQCGHEYHTDCIKQWLLRKKDCPICRASVLPSQEQR
ncbi:probable E3 ubiquitin-protein ligase HIP1 [Solanum dulcamara]|uniref:probable E3 ubiquitin-protein ligase HIP1 n=1 Tax=Solanum dulcamara TaxID=45834 RepID=UPI0024856A31|nr:probable E3 ubiquitin-protein ligase HIP1 [Solanum dulcamara]